MYVHHLWQKFEEVAAANRDRSALLFSVDRRVAYGELRDQAVALSRTLAALGVARREVVAIEGTKEPDTFAAMLACLRLGAPYVILDPAGPAERLIRILERCNPVRILAVAGRDSELTQVAARTGTPLTELGKSAPVTRAADAPSGARTLRLTGSDPAYIMFTSGSTGFPKGAVMTHDNVLNLVDWSRSHYGFGVGERLTNVNPLYFDNSVFDFYSSLFTGATLVPFTRKEVRAPGELVRKIDELECTSWFSVPSLLIYLQTVRAFSTGTFRSVRRFIFGGEGYPRSRLKELFDLYGKRAELHNVYGPTECTCICSSYKLSQEDFQELGGFPPLGSLIPNFDGLILGPGGEPVPEGELGELYLRGPNVGRGYYNDQERTEQAFVQDPENPVYADRVYRTGDLVRLDPSDGKLWIQGRVDNQVKRMGYRIELEEIETALCRLPDVTHAAVVYLPDEGGGPGQLIAAVQGDPGRDAESGEREMRRQLSELVPSYMLPDRIKALAHLPVNRNGKIDRTALVERFRSS